MQTASHKQSIDAVTGADSVIALLGQLDTDNFPREERIAVATVQSAAIVLRLNWVSKLCGVLSDRESTRGDKLETSKAEGASGNMFPQHPVVQSKWLKLARASYVVKVAWTLSLIERVRYNWSRRLTWFQLPFERRKRSRSS